MHSLSAPVIQQFSFKAFSKMPLAKLYSEMSSSGSFNLVCYSVVPCESLFLVHYRLYL